MTEEKLKQIEAKAMSADVYDSVRLFYRSERNQEILDVCNALREATGWNAPETLVKLADGNQKLHAMLFGDEGLAYTNKSTPELFAEARRRGFIP